MAFDASIPAQPRSFLPMVLLCTVVALTGAVIPWRPTRSSNPSRGAVAVSPGVTTIRITPAILHADVKRFGINLSGQTFYDSGQMLKNLTFRNPGFEGETWQSILHCKSVAADTCTDEQQYSTWPDHFLDGARFEVFTGLAKGSGGTVRSSTAASSGHGVSVTFADTSTKLTAGDFILVRLEKPGDAQAGWWTNVQGGATLSTEFHDLSPKTPGRQALRIDALQDDQRATVSSYFDSTEGHSFVQLRGSFVLHFRAKTVAGARVLPVNVARGSHVFLNKTVALTPSWQDYALSFPAKEDGSARGTVGLTFTVEHSAVLLDDVDLVPLAPSSDNPTAFRDDVVNTLRALKPGVLRFMDNGTSFGSTLDDLLAVPFARRRGGSQLSQSRAEDIPIGLHESLVLAHAIGAEPWYTLPATLSPAEAERLIQYLSGEPSTPYGARRAQLGQTAPWTNVFPLIHLEFGNEMWGTSPGATINQPASYAARASAIFAAMRSSPGFKPQSFDLIGDAQAENTWWTPHALAPATSQDSIDFAPYLFSSLDDVSSTDAIFGAMFAEPEQTDINGTMAQQVKLARNAAHPARPVVYEVNMGTVRGKNPVITQDQIDSAVASTGAGVAVADHMLLMLRELGITNQCLFALPEFANRFDVMGRQAKSTPLWGSVVDMGGATNLRRPTFYTLQLANRALLPRELGAELSGADPTWNQPASPNGNVQSGRPHLLQTFAFADKTRRSMILFNLSRDQSLPVAFAGSMSPAGMVTESRFTSAHITDTNEHASTSSIIVRTLNAFDPAAAYRLPPFSMTVLEWQARP